MKAPLQPSRLRAGLAALAQERGSQAAEYAMIGGVGAAACGTLIALLKDKAMLGRVVEAVFSGLARVAGSWF